ncbi:MAG TPA: hypothetical protein VFY16_03340, partial [Gemmatimonadaceae bacterium]|nr:hypothetical protein [Gemmatimonadaceae bacterium]
MLGTTSSVGLLSRAAPAGAGRMASTSVTSAVRRERLALAAILLGFVALAVALALTRPPHTDEGHFANAAALFAREGRLAMPMWIEWSPTLDQRMYITPPLYFVALGGWFELFGMSFPSMRLFSVLWGVLLVAAWSVVAPAVSGRRSAALFGAALVGLNYDVVNIASARYDIMAAALNALALAAYLAFRARHLTRAALVAGALLATSCVVHPYGVFGIVLVASFALTLDLRRLGWREVLCGMAPFVVTLGAWGLYIAQDPAMFQAQFGQNASGRMVAYRAPLAAFASELRERYLVLFGGMRGSVPAAMRAKLGVLLLYAGGVTGCLLLPALRRRPAVRALLVATAATFLMLVFLESNRWYVYLIHIIPLYATCAAVLCAELLARGAWVRRTVLAGAALFAAFSV